MHKFKNQNLTEKIKRKLRYPKFETHLSDRDEPEIGSLSDWMGVKCEMGVDEN